MVIAFMDFLLKHVTNSETSTSRWQNVDKERNRAHISLNQILSVAIKPNQSLDSLAIFSTLHTFSEFSI